MREHSGFDSSSTDEIGMLRDHYGTEDGSRREVLAKIGRFAYAVPVLALLTEPKLALAGYGGGGGGKKPKKIKKIKKIIKITRN